MKIFDLHCDTLYEMEKQRLGFTDAANALDICAARISRYERYLPVMAVWSDNSLTESEQWKRFFEIADYTLPNLPRDFEYVLAVEDAGLLEGELSRLDTLYERGVCVITPVWGGMNCLGGAHDTNEGLSRFGAAAVKRCFELGITVDVSHASDELFCGVRSLAAQAGIPFIASHSLSRAVHLHSRNLTDDMFRDIMRSGGVVGVSLEPTHLGGTDAQAVCRHILHFLSLSAEGKLSGERALCLGCDFDGVTGHLDDISAADKLPALARALRSHGVCERVIEDIFWNNAKAFADRHFN